MHQARQRDAITFRAGPILFFKHLITLCTLGNWIVLENVFSV
jgi:hypothetical protein